MSKNDGKIKKLMEVVEGKRSDLGTKPKTAWATNGIFKFNGQKHLNLNTVHESDVLVEALSHILCNRSSFIEASKILGVENTDIEYDGYSSEEWTADFKLRISQINWDSEKKKLGKLEKQLQGLISEDAKTEMALDEIMKELA